MIDYQPPNLPFLKTKLIVSRVRVSHRARLSEGFLTNALSNLAKSNTPKRGNSQHPGPAQKKKTMKVNHDITREVKKRKRENRDRGKPPFPILSKRGFSSCTLPREGTTSVSGAEPYGGMSVLNAFSFSLPFSFSYKLYGVFCILNSVMQCTSYFIHYI